MKCDVSKSLAAKRFLEVYQIGWQQVKLQIRGI